AAPGPRRGPDSPRCRAAPPGHRSPLTPFNPQGDHQMPAALIGKALLATPPAVPEGQAKVRVFDTRTRGFIAEFRRNVVTFYFRYRDPRGRGREVKLGRLSDVSLDQARRRAEQLKAETSLGADPVA